MIGLAVVYQSYKVGKAIEYQKTILVPFGLDAQLEVSGDDLTEESADYYARRVNIRKGHRFSRDHPEELQPAAELYAP